MLVVDAMGSGRVAVYLEGGEWEKVREGQVAGEGKQRTPGHGAWSMERAQITLHINCAFFCSVQGRTYLLGSHHMQSPHQRQVCAFRLALRATQRWGSLARPAAPRLPQLAAVIIPSLPSQRQPVQVQVWCR